MKGHNPRTFYLASSAGGSPTFTTYPVYNVGQGSPPVPPQFMPDYGHTMKVASGPNFIAGDEGGIEIVDVETFLHSYTLRPGGSYFDAIAHYTNDPRIAPLGQAYQTAQQQAMVTIPYARRSPLAFGTGTSLTTGYTESYFQTPMVAESIAHAVIVPRKDIANIEAKIAAHGNELHLLPIHTTPCLFMGADTRMHGVQWLEVTYHWQWQAGVVNISPNTPKTYGSDGVVVPNTGAVIPPQVDTITPILVSQPMVLPPYHTIDMIFEIESIGQIQRMSPRWRYQMPYRYVAIGWKGLVGHTKFIWGSA